MRESWEIAIALPLGVVANQLMKVESDLRTLNMKALKMSGEDDAHPDSRGLEQRLERIGEAVEAIQRLIAEFNADLHPKSAAARNIRRDDKIRTNRDD